ncbi:MAG TPA: biopolymer transporter ExbD [Candidatus Acidoferrum sp.]|jgi:biopolymer transport protein ExbD
MRADGFYPSKKAAQRGNRFLIELNLWPLVAVLIVLLVIFMVGIGSTNVCTRGFGPELAVVRHAVPLPHAVREDAMRVTITRDDSIFFGNMRLTAEDLPEKIGEDVRTGSEKRVYMVVDARTKYASVKRVLASVRDARIENVSFLLENNR